MTAPTIIQHRMLRFCCWEAAITDVDARTTAAFGEGTGACEEALSAALNVKPAGAWREQAARRWTPKNRASVM